MAERSLNRVQILGRLGKDAEGSFTPAGHHVAKFSAATTKTWKDASGEEKSQTNWINFVMWRKEKLSAYLTKGTRVYVEGALTTRSYDGNDGKRIYVTEVVVDELILLGDGKGKSDADDQYHNQAVTPRQAHSNSLRAGALPPEDLGISDSDLPF